jgi:hypothetical protein
MSTQQAKASFHGCSTKLTANWQRLSTKLKFFRIAVVTKFSYLFRALGLRLVNVVTLGGQETAKPVLQKSFWIALSRCAVHLLPSLVFAWILVLNYAIVYIGPGFSILDRYDSFYLALFQIAAKCQELLCLASLGTVLLDALRQDLLYGPGVSLGLLPSHLWFSQASYVVSPEFLVAVQQCYRDGWMYLKTRTTSAERRQGRERLVANLRLVLLLSIFIPLGVLIGPFSAVLLIPKLQYYPAGGASFALEASAEQLWPDTLDAGAELDVCYWPNATEYPICPSGGFASLSMHKGYRNTYDSRIFNPSLSDDETAGDTTSSVGANFLGTNFAVMDPLQLFPSTLSRGNSRESYFSWNPTFLVQPNMYSTIRLQMLLRDWRSAANGSAAAGSFLGSRAQYILSKAPRPRSRSTVPYVHVRCTAAQNLTQHAKSASFVRMAPRREMGRTWQLYNHEFPINITALKLDPSDHVRAQWLELPPRDFGTHNVSAGMLFELPWSRTSKSRLAVACTVQAIWANAAMSRTDAGHWYVDYDANLTLDPAIKPNLSASDPDAARFGRLVDLRPDWLALLNPIIREQPVGNSSWAPNLLEKLFNSAGFDVLMQRLRTEPQQIRVNGTCVYEKLDPSLSDLDLWYANYCSGPGRGDMLKIPFIERTIARLVADGMSRRYSYLPLDMQPSLPNWRVKQVTREADYDARLLQGHPSRNAIILPGDASFPRQTVDFYVYGYGYILTTWSDKMAVGVISIYLIFAISHTIWTLAYKPVTSSSWDTTLELLLLCWNSLPAPALRGTSAEVGSWDTYRKVVKVRAEEQTDPNSLTGSKELALRLVLAEDCQVDGKDSLEIAATKSSNGTTVTTSTIPQQQTGVKTSLRLVEAEKKYV